MYVCCMYALVCLRFVFTNGRSDAANAAASVQHGYRLGLDGASKVTQPLRKEASSNLGRRVKSRSVLHNFDVRRGARAVDHFNFGKDSLYHTRLIIIISAPHSLGRLAEETTRAGRAGGAFVVFVLCCPNKRCQRLRERIQRSCNL